MVLVFLFLGLYRKKNQNEFFAWGFFSKHCSILIERRMDLNGHWGKFLVVTTCYLTRKLSVLSFISWKGRKVSTQCYFMLFFYALFRSREISTVKVLTPNPGQLEEDCAITNGPIKFMVQLCNRWKLWNHLNLPDLSGNNPQILLMLLVRLKKNLRIFCFQKKSCDWIIFFQVSRFECPRCSRLLIVPYFPWDRQEQALKQGFVQVMA